jgi:hypothetical protein
LIVDELVLLALPVEAEPPVVLPATVALPLLAVCELLLETCKSLLLVTDTCVSTVFLTVLYESGPVFELVPDWLPDGSALAASAAALTAPVLSTFTLALRLFAFAALPVDAPPPVVLW